LRGRPIRLGAGSSADEFCEQPAAEAKRDNDGYQSLAEKDVVVVDRAEGMAARR
jgi:hypothetical protein